MIFDKVVPRIFDPKNCSKYLENEMSSYLVKRLEKQEGGLSEICFLCGGVSKQVEKKTKNSEFHWGPLHGKIGPLK